MDSVAIPIIIMAPCARPPGVNVVPGKVHVVARTTTAVTDGKSLNERDQELGCLTQPSKAEGGKCNSAGVDYTNKVLGPGSYSPDGTCGGKSRYNCYGFGTCCSASGYCGSSTDYCGAGCQEAFGLCANWADSITTDGRCGVINGKSCPGSECCSESGYCGGPGEEYCGPGCQPYGGICNPTSNITTDGSCGTNGRTCMGSRFGDCCSASGYCGKTTDYCGTGW